MAGGDRVPAVEDDGLNSRPLGVRGSEDAGSNVGDTKLWWGAVFYLVLRLASTAPPVMPASSPSWEAMTAMFLSVPCIA